MKKLFYLKDNFKTKEEAETHKRGMRSRKLQVKQSKDGTWYVVGTIWI